MSRAARAPAEVGPPTRPSRCSPLWDVRRPGWLSAANFKKSTAVLWHVPLPADRRLSSSGDDQRRPCRAGSRRLRTRRCSRAFDGTRQRSRRHDRRRRTCPRSRREGTQRRRYAPSPGSRTSMLARDRLTELREAARPGPRPPRRTTRRGCSRRCDQRDRRAGTTSPSTSGAPSSSAVDRARAVVQPRPRRRPNHDRAARRVAGGRRRSRTRCASRVARTPGEGVTPPPCSRASSRQARTGFPRARRGAAPASRRTRP